MSELKDQLKRLNDRVEELVNAPSELTKDALLAETRTFYDLVKATTFAEEIKPTPTPKKKPAPKTVAAPEPIKTPEPEIESIITAVEPPKEEPKIEPEVVAEKPKDEKPKAAELVEEKPKAKKQPMIGKDEPAAEDGDKKILAGKFNNSPLTDLRSGIPLNEKFGIIRNLFKGNASDFGDAVLKLNNAANATELAHYMDLLKQRFEWDERVEAYQVFAGYVERKKLTLESSNANADQ